MYVLDKNIENELIVKNSKFITILFKINSKEEVNSYLDEMKNKYPKATHYCYAYIIGDYKKASDDGEPGGTAGMPILNVLEKEELTNILCIVIRYFGGIKLGAGGLVRAYSKSVRETIKMGELRELQKGKKVRIIIPYEKQKQIDYILKNEIILEKEFNDKVIYLAEVNEEILENLNHNDYQILEEVWIEKRS